jgi:branched-chain amino acid transport system ATP-binding protein
MGIPRGRSDSLQVESALALANIDAFCGDSHILHDVSFTLEPGRLLGLLGLNGAGKSTSMNVATGLLPPRRGRIMVFGKDVAGFPPERISREGVALVPQGWRTFKSLTVQENLVVAERRADQGQPRAWSLERVFEMFPRLQERKSQLAGHLSGGEQQQLGFLPTTRHVAGDMSRAGR